MKLKIRSAEPHIEILSISEGVTPKDIQILKAGIANLLKNGKNRIVLELSTILDLPGEVLRELSMLDVLARELAGRIVIGGVSPLLETKVKSFAVPPVVSCFGSLAEAIRSFEPPRGGVMPPSPEDVSIVPVAVSRPPDAAKVYKDELRDREQGELGKIRRRLEELERENLALRTQLKESVEAHAKPASALAAAERIKGLEEKLEKLLEAPSSKT